MKLLAVLLFVIGVTYGAITPEQTTAFGYLTEIGIPEAERIRNAEEKFLNDPSRVVGGQPSASGQFPWQVKYSLNYLRKYLYQNNVFFPETCKSSDASTILAAIILSRYLFIQESNGFFFKHTSYNDQYHVPFFSY